MLFRSQFLVGTTTAVGGERAYFLGGTAATPAATGVTIGNGVAWAGAALRTAGDTIRIAMTKTPATAADIGTTGDICWGANYIYVCVWPNTWKRAPMWTW